MVSTGQRKEQRAKDGRLRRASAGVFLFLLCTQPSVLHAQQGGAPGPGAGLDVQNFQIAPGPRDGIAVRRATIPGHLQLSGGMLLHYARKPLVFETRDGYELYRPILDDRLQSDLFLSIGLVDRLELALVMPASIYQEGPGADLRRLAEVNRAGLGDMRLSSKVLLGSWEASHLALAMLFDLTLPSGDADQFLGEGAATYTPGLVLSTLTSPVQGSLQLGYRFREDRRFYNLVLKDELIYRAGLGITLVPRVLEVLAEAYGSLRADDPLDSQDVSPLETMLGARCRTWRDLTFTLGGGVGMVKGYGTPEYRVLAGLAWAPQQSDRDGDGLLDEDDGCPTEPEDLDGFQDADGCPDPDNDGDGLLDVQDRCPDEAEDLDGFEDGDGCPDLDNDRDGIPDTRDRCPSVAEDKDGFQDEDGCPDPDNDGDGLLDAQDRCPDEPEDRDGFQDADGCPDPDNDNDRIPDVRDECPNEPEVYNGLEDEDGCPDQTRVTIEQGKLTISEKIFFEFNKDLIKPVSFPLLDEVAATMKANPQLRLVRVEGHTDGVGEGTYNLELSQRRAAAVMRYLVEAGTDPGRLVAQGFGEDRPIDTNETEEGRSRNRRVEFVIVEEQ